MRFKRWALLSVLFCGLIFPAAASVSFAQGAVGPSTVKVETAPEAKVEAETARIEQLEEKIELLNKNVTQKTRSVAGRLLAALVIILVGLGLFFLLQFGLARFEEALTEKGALREKDNTLRLKTMVRLFHWLGSLMIVGMVLYMVLENFGVNVAPLLAGAGIVGLAFGFGGQYLIRDLINGIFVLLEGQYSINDVVRIGEFRGVVESVNLRVTTLRDGEGSVITIPNGEIKTVVNFTKDFSRAVLEVGVAYKENVDHVMAVIRQVGAELRKDDYFGKLILDDLEMQGVENFGDSQVTLRFRVKTVPTKQWEVAREVRRRIKNRFDELGIEIPFPHRTLYMGTGKDNDALRTLIQDRTGEK